MLYFAIFMLIILLLFPQICIQGATSGLLLWFNTIIPTLFPFLFLTNLISYKNGFHLFEKIFGCFIKIIFRTSHTGSYPVLTGLFCGYPMGAKVTCDCFHSGNITKEEAKYLLTFTNNPSPIFIANYICITILENKKLIIPCLLIIYLSTIITARITYHLFHVKTLNSINVSNKSTSQKAKSLTFFDQCITQSCDTLVHIGGYMIIFSIMSQLIFKLFSGYNIAALILSGVLEQTTGLNLLKTSNYSKQIKTVLAMCFAGFGGVSILAQIYSIIHRHGLSLKYYLVGKSLFTMIIGILTYLYYSISS